MRTSPISSPRGFAYCLLVAIVLLVGGAAEAVEIGQVAPDFSLRATTGGTVSLSQFRGQQAVLIEFYSADFAPV